MLQPSQAHVLSFCDGRNTLPSIKFCSGYVWLHNKLPTNLGVQNNNNCYCFSQFCGFTTCFFLHWVNWWHAAGERAGLQRPHSWHGGGDGGMARIHRYGPPEPHTGPLQHGTQDGQFHHPRAHSSTENVPRDCVSCQASSDMGLETGTTWLLPLCKGHSSSFKGRGQNPHFSVGQLSRNLWPSLVFHIPSSSLPSVSWSDMWRLELQQPSWTMRICWE